MSTERSLRQAGIYENSREDWKSEANCVGVDPGLFYPERGASTKEAKAVCQGCVVSEQCLAYGLDEKYGIWAGLSERQRRRLRRERHTQPQEEAS